MNRSPFTSPIRPRNLNLVGYETPKSTADSPAANTRTRSAARELQTLLGVSHSSSNYSCVRSAASPSTSERMVTRSMRSAIKSTPNKAVHQQKNFRFRCVALKEIRKYQESVVNLMNKAPHDRLCREIAQQINCDWRFRAATLEQFQQITESFVPGVLNDSQECAIHAKRVTPQPKDVRLAWKVRGDKLKYGNIVPHKKSEE